MSLATFPGIVVLSRAGCERKTEQCKPRSGALLEAQPIHQRNFNLPLRGMWESSLVEVGPVRGGQPGHEAGLGGLLVGVQGGVGLAVDVARQVHQPVLVGDHDVGVDLRGSVHTLQTRDAFKHLWSNTVVG